MRTSNWTSSRWLGVGLCLLLEGCSPVSKSTAPGLPPAMTDVFDPSLMVASDAGAPEQDAEPAPAPPSALPSLSPDLLVGLKKFEDKVVLMQKQTRLYRHARLGKHAKKEGWKAEHPPVKATAEQKAWWGEWKDLEKEAPLPSVQDIKVEKIPSGEVVVRIGDQVLTNPEQVLVRQPSPQHQPQHQAMQQEQLQPQIQAPPAHQ